MITYTWHFPQFDTAKSEDGLSDVVKVIQWRYVAVDDEASAQAYGAVNLSAPDPAAFTAYVNLTEQWAIDAVIASWSDSSLADVQEALQAQIEVEKNPPVVPLQPPFLG
jgi:hypothetical protein|tara:strand:- start:317 stop:643 length:327 start_codon:yes stop_codon:yes gene_type:complete